MTDCIYCTIAPNTPAAKPFDDFQKSRRKHIAWVKDFAYRHGFDNYILVGNHNILVIGFAPKIQETKVKGLKGSTIRVTNRLDAWDTFIQKHPLWRLVKEGTNYSHLVPRKRTPAEKAVCKEWDTRPKPMSVSSVKVEVTGVNSFDAWLRSNTLHSIGWRYRDDGTIIVALPYFVVDSKEWKPLKGLVKEHNQDKLRREYDARVIK